MMSKPILLLLVLVLSFVFAQEYKIHYKVAEAIDKSINPCADFYKYSCGNWIKNVKINPKVFPLAANVASLMQDYDTHFFYHLLESKKLSPTLHNFFTSCQNTNTQEKLTIQQFQRLMGRIDNMVAKKGIWYTAGVLQSMSVSTFWRVAKQVNTGNSERYYWTMSPPICKVPIGNLRALGELLVKIGAVKSSKLAEPAAKDLALLASQIHRVRDSFKSDTSSVSVHLNKIAPTIDWQSYRQASNLKSQNFIVSNKNYFENLDKVLRSAPKDAITTFFKLRVLIEFKSALPTSLRVLLFNAFTGKNPVRTPNRKRECLHLTQKWLGLLLSKYYVERSFSMESRKMARDMVNQIKRAFGNMFQGTKWLDASSKAKALLKLKMMRVLIAGPKQYPNFAKIAEMSSTDFLTNLYKARSFEFSRTIGNPNKTVPIDHWETNPSMINAYNSISPNEFVLPTGILHTPIFDTAFSDPVNYGRAGVIIAHEMSHGFDTNGQQYNQKGDYAPSWWSARAKGIFLDKTKCYITQYSKFKDRMFRVNGKITLEENIADNVGMRAAYNALAAKMGPKKFKQASTVPNLNNEQLFFVAFAQRWCQKDTLMYSIQYKNDPHAAVSARVNGSVQNMPEFAKAFKCPANTPNNPQKRCELF